MITDEEQTRGNLLATALIAEHVQLVECQMSFRGLDGMQWSERVVVLCTVLDGPGLGERNVYPAALLLTPEQTEAITIDRGEMTTPVVGRDLLREQSEMLATRRDQIIASTEPPSWFTQKPETD